MRVHHLTAFGVAELIGRKTQTVHCYMCGSKHLPDELLQLLKYQLQA